MLVYVLSAEEIDRIVTETGPASYTLGYKTRYGAYVTRYVGRVNGGPGDGLKARLKKHLGEHAHFKFFEFTWARSIPEAYEMECREYHLAAGEDGELVNDSHPTSPAGTGLRCRTCGK